MPFPSISTRNSINKSGGHTVAGKQYGAHVGKNPLFTARGPLEETSSNSPEQQGQGRSSDGVGQEDHLPLETGPARHPDGDRGPDRGSHQGRRVHDFPAPRRVGVGRSFRCTTGVRIVAYLRPISFFLLFSLVGRKQQRFK